MYERYQKEFDEIESAIEKNRNAAQKQDKKCRRYTSDEIWQKAALPVSIISLLTAVMVLIVRLLK